MMEPNQAASVSTPAIVASCTLAAPVPNVVVDSSAPTISVSDESRKWAKKRRMRPTGLCHIRNDAAGKISDVAAVQCEYYTAKLETAREKHAAEMEILNLQKQLLAKQLHVEA